jgi:hypothetical protein
VHRPGASQAAGTKAASGTQIDPQAARERRRQVRGLVLLAAAAIGFAILRAGVHRVFTPGWWRLW